MEYSEKSTTELHGFFIRIWLEEEESNLKEPALWRGRITHIPSRKSQYFQTQEELLQFITIYTGPWR